MNRESALRSHIFNLAWFYLSGFVLLIGITSGQIALSILGASIFVMAGISWLYARYSLQGLIYTHSLSAERVFRGESVTLECQIENPRWLGLSWLDIEEQVSDRLLPEQTNILPSTQVASSTIRHSTTVRWQERLRWSVDIACPERGSYTIGPTTLRSGDPFGFFTRVQTLPAQSRFLVYPTIVPLEELGFPADAPFGDQRRARHIIADPSRTIGIREYRPDDSFRDIHWKATARQQELHVRVYEPAVTERLGIFLNLDTFERYWEGVDTVRTETAISVAASIAHATLKQRGTIGLTANGMIAGSDQLLRLKVARGIDQRIQMLEALAKLSPLAATHFPRLLRSETRGFTWGSTIVVISALMTLPLHSVLDLMVQEGRSVILVRIGDYPVDPIRGLKIYTVRDTLASDMGMIRHRYARFVPSNGSDRG